MGPTAPSLVFDTQLAGQYFRHGMETTRHAVLFSVPEGFQLPVVHASGEVRAHSVSFYGFFDPGGPRPGLITTTMDVTTFDRSFQPVPGSSNTWTSRPVLAYQVTAKMLQGTDGRVRTNPGSDDAPSYAELRIGQWLVQRADLTVEVVPRNSFASDYYSAIHRAAA
jgi:hypothetical protein